MSDHQIIKGIAKGLGQLGIETLEKAKEEGGKIIESVITGKELLGLDRTMSDSELEFQKQKEKSESDAEARKLRSEMGPGRKVEEEVTQLRNQEQREEEEKEKYYEREKQQRERERQIQEQNMNMDLLAPKKHHKDKGGNKHKTQQPDQSQMSQTQEFKGKID